MVSHSYHLRKRRRPELPGLSVMTDHIPDAGEASNGNNGQVVTCSRANSSGSSSARSITSTDSDSGFLSNSRILNLPLELQMQIVEYMAPDNFIRFSLAHYAHLQCKWLEHLPPITPTIYMNLVSTSPPRLGPMCHLAPELLLLIMNRLPRRDLMAFALANYRLLQNKGIVDELGKEDTEQLRLSMDFSHD